jgi:hypothetical protein
MGDGIFISYRRGDTKHAAGRLVDRLRRTFSSDQLFLDIDNIDPGLDFEKVMLEKLQACDVLLAVIGPGWLSSSDETGVRRLDNPKDYVRIEIETALARDIRVIPVLVDGAPMPDVEHLPDQLRPLAERNAVRLEHERFGSDADNLTRALAKIVTPSNSRAKRFQSLPPALAAPMRPRDLVAWTLAIGFALFCAIAGIALAHDVLIFDFPRLKALFSIDAELTRAVAVVGIAALPATFVGRFKAQY